MLRLRFLLGFSLLSLRLIFPSSNALAGQQLENLAVGYSSLAGHHTPMWIAVEDRIGRKYGIDLKAIYAGRLRPQQLLMSGDVPIVVATGSGALTSHVLGPKDQVIVAINMTKVGGGIFAKNEIRSAKDLRGKTIGVSRAGSISEIVLRYVLRAKLGLQPDRDVKLLVVGDPAVGLQALERGIVDATPLTMPLPLMAAKMGFRELVNYDALGITFPANTVTTSRQTIGKRPELIDSFLRILIEGIYIFKSNKPKSLAIMKKNLLGASDEVLEETYRYTTAVLEQQPYPSLDVIRSGLEILSLQYPQAKQTDPNPLVDASFVKRIDQSGFIAALYKN
jgi:ABC-type nitrate/sulfonate/bicarbonate transport system substrate-binding protein